MKKTFTYFLLLVYVLASFGVVINFHYCADELAGVKVNAIGKSGCECDAESEDAGCCHEDVSLVKLKELHQSQINEEISFSKLALPILFFNYFSLVIKNESVTSFCFIPPKPPDINHNKVYKEINVFLI